MNDIKTLHQLDLTSDEDLLCLDADQEIKKSLGPSSENWFDILTQQKAHERRNTSKRDFLHNENREPNLSDQDDNGTPESTSFEKHINTINGHECKNTEDIRKCGNPILETVTVLDQSTSATKQLNLPTSQVNHFPLKRKSDSCINTSGFKIDVGRRWSCESEKNCSSKKAKLAGEFNPWIQSPTGMNSQKNSTKNESLATHKNNLVTLPGNSQTTMKLRTSKKSVTKPSSFRQPANLKHYSSENDHGVDSDEEFLGFVELYEKQSNKKYSTMDSKITGFQTASNKGINISVKSWKKVQKLFSEDSNFVNTCESLPKQAENSTDTTTVQNDTLGTLKRIRNNCSSNKSHCAATSVIGFETKSMQAKSPEQVPNLLYDNQECKSMSKELKNERQLSSKTLQVMETDNYKKGMIPVLDANAKFVGCKTASTNGISVQTTPLSQVSELGSDNIVSNNMATVLNDGQTVSAVPIIEVKSSSNDFSNNVTDKTKQNNPFSSGTNTTVVNFKTASNKNLSVSSKSLEIANNLMKDVVKKQNCERKILTESNDLFQPSKNVNEYCCSKAQSGNTSFKTPRKTTNSARLNKPIIL